LLQIEDGLLTDQDGSRRDPGLSPGNTADPSACSEIVEVIRTRFGLERLVMVGDRRMITSARIETLKLSAGSAG
jgi:transposase